MKNYLIIFSIGFLFLMGCQDKEYGPVVTDSIPPKPVTVDTVISIPGGAMIKYDTPDDVDFAYVKAVFLRKGVESESRASSYTNIITIEGLENTDPREVKLYSVDKSENISSPVKVVISPDTPPYIAVFNTIDITPDFGGALFQWKNETGTPVQVELFAADSSGALRSRAVVPSNMEEGIASLRGYDTIPRVFGALVYDKWDNYTADTLKKTIKPWYEEEFDKSNWLIVNLPNDHDWSAWAGQDYNMFDNDLSNFCHTWGGTGWPQAFTIDLAGLKKISRMKLWMRSTAQQFFYYTHGNPKEWKVFGRADAPDPDADVPYDGDESWENIGWTLMLNKTPGSTDPKTFVMIKPSEMGGSPEEDLQQALNGAEFIFDVQNPEVRYVRVLITKTWDGANYVTFSELSFFGSSRE
jgi:hypothetical protein